MSEKPWTHGSMHDRIEALCRRLGIDDVAADMILKEALEAPKPLPAPAGCEDGCPVETPNRYKGTVKWYNDSKGFGWINRVGEEQVFVHHTSIQTEGYRSLSEGDRVEFEIKKGTMGLQAVNVRKLVVIEPKKSVVTQETIEIVRGSKKAIEARLKALEEAVFGKEHSSCQRHELPEGTHK